MTRKPNRSVAVAGAPPPPPAPESEAVGVGVVVPVELEPGEIDGDDMGPRSKMPPAEKPRDEMESGWLGPNIRAVTFQNETRAHIHKSYS